MHPQDLALVGFRVAAVFLGTLSLPGVVGLGELVLGGTNDFGMADKAAILMMGVFLFALPAAIAFLLWVLAPRLAKLAIREQITTDDTASLSARELTRCGLIIVGTYVTVVSLPGLASQLLIFYAEPTGIPAQWPVSSALSCVLGIAVVLGSDRIAGLTKTWRYAGRSK